MPGLLDYLPDADALLALSPEDLGMMLRELMQQQRGSRSDFETSGGVRIDFSSRMQWRSQGSHRRSGQGGPECLLLRRSWGNCGTKANPVA